MSAQVVSFPAFRQRQLDKYIIDAISTIVPENQEEAAFLQYFVRFVKASLATMPPDS